MTGTSLACPSPLRLVHNKGGFGAAWAQAGGDKWALPHEPSDVAVAEVNSKHCGYGQNVRLPVNQLTVQLGRGGPALGFVPLIRRLRWGNSLRARSTISPTPLGWSSSA